MVLADKMRMSESSQNTAARLWVNLILDQCLQNKEFETVLIRSEERRVGKECV